MAPKLNSYERKRVIEQCEKLGPPKYGYYITISKELAKENITVTPRGVRKIYERFQLSSCIQNSTKNVGPKSKVKQDVRMYINLVSRHLIFST